MIPFQVQSFSYPYQYQVQIQSSSSCSSLYQPNYYVGYMNPSIPIDYDIPPETSADNGPEKKIYHTLFVSNIPFGCNYQILLNSFSKFGQISNCHICQANGSFFVSYYNLSSAEDALANVKFQKIDGRSIQVNYSSQNPDNLTSVVIVKSSKKEYSILTIDELETSLLNFGKIFLIEEGYQITKNSGDRKETIQKVIIKGVWYAKKCVDQIAIIYGSEKLFLQFVKTNQKKERLKNVVHKEYYRKRVRTYSTYQQKVYGRSIQNISKPTQKVLQFSMPSPAKDSEIFEFRKNHSPYQTKVKFGIGDSRLKRIERQLGQNQKRIRRYSKEHHAFIVQTALNGVISSKILLREFRGKFPDIKISRSTIIRLLFENKFRFRKPRHIQFLTMAHKFNRYNFSIKMLAHFRGIFKCIIFSDECRFCQTPDNNCRWIMCNDFREEKCAKYSKYTFGTMAWGAIGLNFKSKLMFPKGKINSEVYQQMLADSNIFTEADNEFGKFRYIFQQDGAPSHKTIKTYNYIEKYAMVLYNWPANSPDLSPIEMVWSIMKNKLMAYENQPKNQEELESLLVDIWENQITYELINDLILSFEYRLEMCRDVYGGSISHFLSAGRKKVNPDDLFDRDYIPHLITPDETRILYEMNARNRHQWKLISETFEGFQIDPKSVKYVVFDIERKVNDFMKNTFKYVACPSEIEGFIPQNIVDQKLDDNDYDFDDYDYDSNDYEEDYEDDYYDEIEEDD